MYLKLVGDVLKKTAVLVGRDGHDFDFKIKIMILKSKSWFDFKSSYI